MCNVTHFSVFSIMCICVSISLCINQSVCLYVFFANLSIWYSSILGLYLYQYRYRWIDSDMDWGWMSVYLPYIYQSIKSVCLLVRQSIYQSVSLYSIHWYVCLYSICQSPSTQNCFPHFQNITKHKTSSGDMFYEQINNVLMH